MNRRRAIHVFSLFFATVFAVVNFIPTTKANNSAQTKTLVVDKILMRFTPQSSGWCMCIKISDGESEKSFSNKDNSGNNKTIEFKGGLNLGEVTPGADIKFTVFLDDNFDEVCDNAEDRSKGTFKAKSSSEKSFRFDKNKGAGNYYPPAGDDSDNVGWSYTIYWHLE